MIQFSVVLPMIRWSFGWFCLPMIRWSFWWFCLPMIRWSNFGFFVEYYRRSDDHISVFLPKITDDPMIIFRFFCRKLPKLKVKTMFWFEKIAKISRRSDDLRSPTIRWYFYGFYLPMNRRSSFTDDPMILFWILFTDEPTIIRPMFYRRSDDHK